MRIIKLPLRRPCVHCAGLDGEARERNGQWPTYCARCGKYAGFTASKAERGADVRSVSRHKLPASQVARIRQRDGRHCVVCGQSDGVLHIGHIISIAEGEMYGLSEAELNSDENLAVMCEEDNAGFRKDSLSLKLLVAILRRRVRGEGAA